MRISGGWWRPHTVVVISTGAAGRSGLLLGVANAVPLPGGTVGSTGAVGCGNAPLSANCAIKSYLQNAMTSSEEEHVSRKQRATTSRGH